MKTLKRSPIPVLVLLLLFYSFTQAAFEDMPAGARLYGFAGAAAAYLNYENLYYNPAGTWLDTGAECGIYTGNLFEMKDLRHSSVITAFNYNHMTIGLGAQTFGYSGYRESSVCIGVSKKLGGILYIGGALRYAGLYIKNYGQDATFLLDLGGILKLSEQLYWGCAVRNVGYASIGASQEKLPQSIISGVQVLPLKTVTVNMDLYKDVHFPLEYRCGAEIELAPEFRVRSGFATEPARFTAGLGLKWRQYGLDYAFNTHPYLNITHLFSLVFSWGK